MITKNLTFHGLKIKILGIFCSVYTRSTTVKFLANVISASAARNKIERYFYALAPALTGNFRADLPVLLT